MVYLPDGTPLTYTVEQQQPMPVAWEGAVPVAVQESIPQEEANDRAYALAVAEQEMAQWATTHGQAVAEQQPTMWGGYTEGIEAASEQRAPR